MRKSVMGGLAEKRIFGRSLLAFTLAATLAFPAASLSFVAQAFADDPSNGDAAEAPAAPVVEPINYGGNDAAININIGMLVFSAIMYSLSAIFRYAALLQQLSDETV